MIYKILIIHIMFIKCTLSYEEGLKFKSVSYIKYRITSIVSQLNALDKMLYIWQAKNYTDDDFLLKDGPLLIRNKLNLITDYIALLYDQKSKARIQDKALLHDDASNIIRLLFGEYASAFFASNLAFNKIANDFLGLKNLFFNLLFEYEKDNVNYNIINQLYVQINFIYEKIIILQVFGNINCNDSKFTNHIIDYIIVLIRRCYRNEIYKLQVFDTKILVTEVLSTFNKIITEYLSDLYINSIKTIIDTEFFSKINSLSFKESINIVNTKILFNSCDQAHFLLENTNFLKYSFVKICDEILERLELITVWLKLCPEYCDNILHFHSKCVLLLFDVIHDKIIYYKSINLYLLWGKHLSMKLSSEILRILNPMILRYENVFKNIQQTKKIYNSLVNAGIENITNEIYLELCELFPYKYIRIEIPRCDNNKLIKIRYDVNNERIKKTSAFIFDENKIQKENFSLKKEVKMIFDFEETLQNKNVQLELIKKHKKDSDINVYRKLNNDQIFYKKTDGNNIDMKNKVSCELVSDNTERKNLFNEKVDLDIPNSSNDFINENRKVPSIPSPNEQIFVLKDEFNISDVVKNADQGYGSIEDSENEDCEDLTNFSLNKEDKLGIQEKVKNTQSCYRECEVKIKKYDNNGFMKPLEPENDITKKNLRLSDKKIYDYTFIWEKPLLFTLSGIFIVIYFSFAFVHKKNEICCCK